MDHSDTIIARGTLKRSSNEHVEYFITNGWNLRSSIECERQWQQSNAELLTYIQDQKYDDERLREVLASISLEDAHWRWSDKALVYCGDEYQWFHLYAEDKPQGACVIFHPKESSLSGREIFYVEYISVAPWNRKNLVRDREFKGVGRALLRETLKFSIGSLNLSPGFCLHSLPGAQNFYSQLQMIRVAEQDKDRLIYFELPAASAEKLMQAA